LIKLSWKGSRKREVEKFRGGDWRIKPGSHCLVKP
jgi:hypothetical protein